MAGGGKRRRRPPASAGARYVAFVGLAFLVLIAIATYNTVSDATGGLLGVSATVRGRPLPEFAVPNVRGGPDADANVFQDDCASSDNPCPPDQRRRSACQVPPRFHAIRVCDLFNRPLVISFWFLEGASCLPTQDVVAKVAQRFRGRVNFLSIDVRDDRSEVDRTVAEHGWRLPSAGTGTAPFPISTASAAARPLPSPTRAGSSRARARARARSPKRSSPRTCAS